MHKSFKIPDNMLEKSLSFLTILKENNYKEWFHENKPLYEEAKKEFESFVGLLIQEIRSIDKSVNFIPVVIIEKLRFVFEAS